MHSVLQYSTIVRNKNQNRRKQKTVELCREISNEAFPLSHTHIHTQTAKSCPLWYLWLKRHINKQRNAIHLQSFSNYLSKSLKNVIQSTKKTSSSQSINDLNRECARAGGCALATVCPRMCIVYAVHSCRKINKNELKRTTRKFGRLIFNENKMWKWKSLCQ